MGRVHPSDVTDYEWGPGDAVAPAEPACLSQSEYASVIGRELAFPLHLSLSTSSIEARSRGYEPGRVLLVGGSGDDGLFRPDLFDVVQTQDVLFAMLFQEYYDEGPVPFVPRHEEIKAVLQDVAPQVRAVMCGNSPYETRFDKILRAETDECRIESVHRMTEFVKRAGGTIRDLGGRPALGIVSPHLILHAYWADQHLEGGDPLRPVLIDLDVLVISFSGAADFWKWEHEWYPQQGKQRTYQWHAQNEDLDEWPFQRMIDWVSGVECWAGVEYLDGLRAGNDEKLAAGGFRGGVIGELPDGGR